MDGTIKKPALIKCRFFIQFTENNQAMKVKKGFTSLIII